MTGGRQQHQPIAPVQVFFQAARGHVVGKDAQVGLAVGDGGDGLLAGFLFQADAHQRLRAHEAGQVLRQELGDRRGVRPDAHVAAHADGEVAHGEGHAVDRVEHGARVVHQFGPGRGQFQPARMAHEQAAVGGAFEFGDAFAQRRHGHVRFVGGAGQAAGERHLQEDAQGLEVEMAGVDHVMRTKKSGAARLGRPLFRNGKGT